jgi:hypothetical protein
MLDDRVPKCTSWRGHRFEARYDDYGGLDGFAELKGSDTTVIAMMNARQKRRVYVRDVCTRCGYTIERAR